MSFENTRWNFTAQTSGWTFSPEGKLRVPKGEYERPVNPRQEERNRTCDLVWAATQGPDAADEDQIRHVNADEFEAALAYTRELEDKVNTLQVELDQARAVVRQANDLYREMKEQKDHYRMLWLAVGDGQ